MKAVLNSIEIKPQSRGSYYQKLEAEIEFDDEEAVAKDLGLNTCLAPFESETILDSIGVDKVKEWLEGKGVEFKEGN